MKGSWIFSSAVLLLLVGSAASTQAQSAPLVALDRQSAASDFALVANGHATAIYVAPQSPETVRVAAEAFAARCGAGNRHEAADASRR